MNYSIDLSPWFDAIVTVGWLSFFILAICAVFVTISCALKMRNHRALKKVMMEQMKLGEEVTVNDEGNDYFSFHVIRIGLDKYYPVLKLQDGKVVVDHLLCYHVNRYLSEKIPGERYELLALQEKSEKLRSRN